MTMSSNELTLTFYFVLTLQVDFFFYYTGMSNELETKEAGSSQLRPSLKKKRRIIHVTFYDIISHFHFHSRGHNTIAGVLK